MFAPAYGWQDASGNLGIPASLVVLGNAQVNGNAQFASAAQFAGPAQFAGLVQVAGNATVTSNVQAASLSGCITDSVTTSSSSLAASAAGLSNVNALASSRLSQAGGAISGGLSVYGNVGVGRSATANAVDVCGNVSASGVVSAASAVFATVVTSNLSVIGNIETVNAYVSHSSNVVITNLGTGPALVVTQTEGGSQQPVAKFVAGSNVGLFVDYQGNVALGKSVAGAALDVSGALIVGGNVGVGKAPTTQLDVSGSANLSGSIAAVTHTGTNMTLTGTAQTSNLTVTGTCTHSGNVGVGKGPAGVGSYALDVSGSVNASGIIVGGSTAKQIDCGSIVCQHGDTISFHFSFTHIPVVVCVPSDNWGNTTIIICTPFQISTSAFKCNITYITGTGGTVGTSGAVINWIAIG